MKLLRVGPPGSEKPGVLIDDTSYIDLSDIVTDFDERFFSADGIDQLRPVVAARTSSGEAVHPLDGQRIGAPIARSHQILCIGLNYRDHAAETGQAVPDEPILFTKSPNTLIGPNDDVRVSRGSTKLDWEVELGIVIGRRTSRLGSAEEARDAIAGCVVVNDVSERAFQMERNGQWVKGKSAETFNPVGPWLVTADEVADVRSLGMWLDVNGAAPPERLDADDDRRPVLHRLVPKPVPGPRARRPDQYWHAAGGRHGVHAAGMAPAGRRHGTGHRRPGVAAPAGGPAAMRAFVITAPDMAGIQEVDPPTAMPGEAVGDVSRAGICGTDVEFFTGGMQCLHKGLALYPVRIGHEWMGTVSAVGEGVDRCWVGRRATGDTMLGCGACRRCRGGYHHVCEFRTELGIRGGRPGALADRVAVPETARLSGAIDAYARGDVDPAPLVAATVCLEDLAPVLAGEFPDGAGPGPKIHVAIQEGSQ
jgi:2,4-didehydro-3-deoxy-L-rhamnonate hydrolase